MNYQNILVIRLGALGDIFLSMQPFQDIRAAFPAARITLLTMPAFAGLARTMPWFDAVITDTRPAWWQLKAWFGLGQSLHPFSKNTLVIDLQNRPRTRLYRRLFFSGNTITWWGAAPGKQPDHAQDGMLEALRHYGVAPSGPLHTQWMAGALPETLPARYAVLIPGCSPHRLHKRWPPQHFAGLAQALAAQGLTPLVIGTKVDAEAIAAIKQAAPDSVDCANAFPLPALASLFRRASLVVGNDTGPTQLAALIGAPTLCLMSYDTNPLASAPRGPTATWLKRPNLADLTVAEVLAALPPPRPQE